MLKVAHIVIVTPRRCGLYETTRELVSNECLYGIDAGMFDPQPTEFYPGIGSDRGAPIVDLPYVREADVLVDHSGLDTPALKNLDKPVIHVAHGRPMSQFLREQRSGAPALSYQYKKASDERYRGVVTFWPEHVPYLELLWGGKPVYTVDAPVDLDAWSPHGSSDYQFGGKRGKINIVLTCPWRDDAPPFAAIHAAWQYARTQRNAKIHLYATDIKTKGLAPLINRLSQHGVLGEVKGWTSDLADIYRAADVVLTPNEINTRTVREAKACGCPVVTGANRVNVKQTAAEIDDAIRRADRDVCRHRAEEFHNPKSTATQFVSAIGKCVPELSGYEAACG